MSFPTLSLTIDDAPSIREPGVPFDAARMDVIRSMLVAAGVQHCVAFVIGDRCPGHEDALRRWLDDGFELGNHTFDHCSASEVSVPHFRESLSRCHDVLLRVDAFGSGRPQWFRFPRLDRGTNPSHRADLARECEALGYRVASASLEICDFRFELPFLSAARSGDAYSEERVLGRFNTTAQDALRKALSHPAQPPLVAYVHFGPVALRALPCLLHLLRSSRISLCPLVVALQHPTYRAYDADFALNDLVLPPPTRTLKSRLRRRLRRASEWLGLFEQKRFGPLWPEEQ